MASAPLVSRGNYRKGDITRMSKVQVCGWYAVDQDTGKWGNCDLPRRRVYIRDREFSDEPYKWKPIGYVCDRRHFWPDAKPSSNSREPSIRREGPSDVKVDCSVDSGKSQKVVA
jgi:hypothetical protein